MLDCLNKYNISDIIYTLVFFYKHTVNLTHPRLWLRFLLFLDNRPIVLPIVLPKNLSLSMLIDVMLIKKKECTAYSMYNIYSLQQPVHCKNLPLIMVYFDLFRVNRH